MMSKGFEKLAVNENDTICVSSDFTNFFTTISEIFARSMHKNLANLPNVHRTRSS